MAFEFQNKRFQFFFKNLSNFVFRLLNVTVRKVQGSYPGLFLLFFAFQSCDSVSSNNEDKSAEQLLVKSATWLWDQQGQDGAWHSKTYGVVKGGEAYTPFVLLALMEIPESLVEKPKGGFQKAMQFIRSHTNEDGILGLSNPLMMEYPNYATAYALRCLIRYGDPGDSTLIRKMTRYLLDQQFVENRGFSPDSLVYGGWGFGETGLPLGVSGHVDLSHTRRVLQALREVMEWYEKRIGEKKDIGNKKWIVENESQGKRLLECFPKTARFLQLLQKAPGETRYQPLFDYRPADEIQDEYHLQLPFDGGFYYSPVILGANKGKEESRGDSVRAHFRSYATATCDGFLSLKAVGESIPKELSDAAVAWLIQHPKLEYPEGMPIDELEPWYKAVHFYHLAVRSEVYANEELSSLIPAGWRTKMTQLLALEQQPDGSFSNQQSPLMKEDDPVLATTHAINAIQGILKPASDFVR